MFRRKRTIHRTREAPALAQFATRDDLQLLDLTDAWIYRAGGEPAEILTGDRETSREWARAIWTVYPHVHGIYYRSVLVPGDFNAALFERAERALPSQPICDLPLTHPGIESIVAVTAHDFALDLI